MESFAPQFIVSKDQAEKENRRLRSVYGSKFKFIALTLNDIRRRSISGVEIVESTAFRDETMGGVTNYLHEVRGGAIKFEFNEALGVWRYEMLDSDHNRQFLASMWDRNFWEIEDSEVKKDIEKRAKKITESMLLLKEETVGSQSRDMKLDHVDAKAKPSPQRPVGKVNIPDAPIGQVNNEEGIVTVGTRMKQV